MAGAGHCGDGALICWLSHWGTGGSGPVKWALRRTGFASDSVFNKVSMMSSATSSQMAFNIMIYRLVFATVISLICYFGASWPSFAQDSSAQDARTLAGFMWKKDVSTGNELAASRSDSSFNFFDIGDLSYYSEVLVEQDFRRIAAAAGLAIERTPTKSSTVAIFHDAKVFSRLRNDKSAFSSLGLPDNILETLQRQVTSDTGKCLNMTITDEKNNIVNTIVLVSEKFDGCLISGLLNTFGIAASDISARTLIDVCILYEGRRRGLRDRGSLAREISKLRELCMTTAGETK